MKLSQSVSQSVNHSLFLSLSLLSLSTLSLCRYIHLFPFLSFVPLYPPPSLFLQQLLLPLPPPPLLLPLILLLLVVVLLLLLLLEEEPTLNSAGTASLGVGSPTEASMPTQTRMAMRMAKSPMIWRTCNTHTIGSGSSNAGHTSVVYISVCVSSAYREKQPKGTNKQQTEPRTEVAGPLT